MVQNGAANLATLTIGNASSPDSFFAGVLQNGSRDPRRGQGRKRPLDPFRQQHADGRNDAQRRLILGQTNANALGGSGNALTLAGGILQLTDSTGLTWGNNTTVTGNSAIFLDRGTIAGAGA